MGSQDNESNQINGDLNAQIESGPSDLVEAGIDQESNEVKESKEIDHNADDIALVESGHTVLNSIQDAMTSQNSEGEANIEDQHDFENESTTQSNNRNGDSGEHLVDDLGLIEESKDDEKNNSAS